MWFFGRPSHKHFIRNRDLTEAILTQVAEGSRAFAGLLVAGDGREGV
ncbi:protein of unknown function [Pararobbsia alpina]